MNPAWAALATSVAVGLARPPHSWMVRHRLGPGAGSSRRPARGRTVLVVLLATAATAPMVLHSRIEGPAPVVLAITGGCLVAFVARQVRQGRRRKRTLAAVAETTEIVDVLAAEIRAGRVPLHALDQLSRDFGVLAPVARVAELGGDVPSALREAATAPGRSGLAAVAAAWSVSERSGAPLADVLERVAASARFETEVAREVRAGVEPARASGRLMALLPLVGLLLGSGLGAGPTRVLTESAVAAVSVSLGVALACAGVVWIDRIAVRAESR